MSGQSLAIIPQARPQQNATPEIVWHSHRDFELVLQQVRTKAFSPDSTRSGMMSSAIVPDPKCSFTVDPTPGPEASEVSPNSGDSSSDSESSDDSSDHEPEAEQQNDPIAAPRAWDPDVVMYRNIRTQVVHVVVGGCVESLLCGVKITQDFEQVDESPFLEIHKCKKCAAKKPIKTVGPGRLASILGSANRR